SNASPDMSEYREEAGLHPRSIPPEVAGDPGIDYRVAKRLRSAREFLYQKSDARQIAQLALAQGFPNAVATRPLAPLFLAWPRSARHPHRCNCQIRKPPFAPD